ncbi:MAG TPA: methyltransferase [Polyangiaceae bacterium]|nr:methyltransferase [Polyangiaceae bacterium]
MWPELLARLEPLEDEEALRVIRLLARCPGMAEAVLEQLSTAAGSSASISAKLRARWFELLARLAAREPSDRLRAALIVGLSDEHARCRRFAASALGELDDPAAEDALVRALENAAPDLSKAVVDALGKLGSDSALHALSTPRLQAQASTLPDLARRVQRARLLIDRRTQRAVAGRVSLDTPLGFKARCVAFCRRGLVGHLLEGLSFANPRTRSDVSVEFNHAGTLRELYRCRTALEFGLTIQVADAASDPATRIARTLSAAELLRGMRAWTDGAPRFRLDWSDGGHQRALTYRVLEELHRLQVPLENDPRAACWTVRAPVSGRGELHLVPLPERDPRFEYRVADVPAASHPTLAAALAQSGGQRSDDIVWDPFLGSGLELVERARLGSYARLIGTDLSSRALQAARANLQSAGVQRYELHTSDALEFQPDDGVTLIVSNPPMGRRVARDGSLNELLPRFVAHAARVLRPKGRLVWLSPLPQLTAQAAQSLPLRLESGPEIDLGGFSATLQIFRRV